MDWIAPDRERQWPEFTGSERASLEQVLNAQRDTLLHKCSGLSEEQLKLASAKPSKLTLLGLVRHMTEVEHWWFRTNLLGDDSHPLYYRDEDPKACFTGAGESDPEEAFERFRVAVDAARAGAASRNLDDTFEIPWAKERGSLRWLYLYMIQEYARHNGHADLIRERIDGATGL
jgi:uncharacterized damage-inducible protein DinB